jgi:hypothetical protein
MDFLKSLIAFIDSIKLVTMLLLIAADLVLGVIIALKNKTFAWERLADYLDTSVLYYMGGYVVLSVLAMQNPDFQVLTTGAAVTIITSLTAGIINKFKELAPATPLPTPAPPVTLPPTTPPPAIPPSA